jgi:hypothetical protein
MATLANQGVASQTAFGQHGSAFADALGAMIVPPAGKSIVAIQFLGDTLLDILVAEDSEQFISIAGSAHNHAPDQVGSQHTASASDANFLRFIDFGATATASRGNYVYSADGEFLAIVKNVGFDSLGVADSHKIELDRDVVIDNSVVLHFSSKQKGGGGTNLDNGNIFPKGLTIYGRWQALSLQASQATDGVICYFGPSGIKREL